MKGVSMYYRIHLPSWTKQQYVNWANERYPGNKSKHSKMKKKQLIAIFINT